MYMIETWLSIFIVQFHLPQPGSIIIRHEKSRKPLIEPACQHEESLESPQKGIDNSSSRSQNLEQHPKLCSPHFPHKELLIMIQ